VNLPIILGDLFRLGWWNRCYIPARDIAELFKNLELVDLIAFFTGLFCWHLTGEIVPGGYWCVF